MEQHSIRSVIVSPDAEFRAALRAALHEGARGVGVAMEIALPYDQIGSAELTTLRERDPELVFLDLESDPALGVRFAHFLAEANPRRRFVAVGPQLGQEMLLEAMRAGISEYLPKPLARESLYAAVERIGRKLVGTSGEARRPGELIAVFSPKGGTGSTTVAANLAVHLQRLSGKRTLLVDLDMELGEAASFLGVQPRFSFVDMIRNFHRMDADLLASYIERDDSGVHLLSAPLLPEAAEVASGDSIRRILHFLKQHYDYVVVDTSKSFSAPTLAAFEQADRILLVTTVDLPSLRNLKRCIPLLERVVGAGSDRVRLVVNRYSPGDPITLQEVRETIGMEVYRTLANDYEAVSRSINTGRPVVLEGKSAFARDLMALGAEIAGLSSERNGKHPRFGPLRKLFASKPEKAAHG
ncbi:MAG TPA: AAA family ATPase [Longimicrobiaceae bacterium]|jgi:pilus assembly protein CpaE